MQSDCFQKDPNDHNLSQTDMTEELLPDWESVDGRREWEDRQTWPREEKKEKTREQQHTTWEQWSLWDQFGSTGEIIQVCCKGISECDHSCETIHTQSLGKPSYKKTE